MDKELLIKLVVNELIEKGQINLIDTVYSADYIAHANHKTYSGHQFLKRWTKQIHSAIKNLKAKNVLILSTDENTVTWQRTLTGIHIRNLKGIPPSHKSVIWNELVVSKFKNDKIIEEWVVSELAGELLIKQSKP